MIAAVEMRLKDRDMALELTQAAKELLATRGFDPVLGARPLRRTVQREIEDMLAEKMLYGEVGPGQIVLVDVEGEGPTATFTFEGRPRTPTSRRSKDLPPMEYHRPGQGRSRRYQRPSVVPRAGLKDPKRPGGSFSLRRSIQNRECLAVRDAGGVPVRRRGRADPARHE